MMDSPTNATYMTVRCIAMLVHTDIRLSAAITALPDIEIYNIANDYEIDMALLTNLETPLKLAFVGGDQARTFAKGYGGVWIEDGPNVEADLLRFWSR